MITRKHTLKKVVKNDDTLSIIEEKVIMANRIIIHIMFFLKIFLLYMFEQSGTIPTVDDKLLRLVKDIILKKMPKGVRQQKPTSTRKGKAKSTAQTQPRETPSEEEDDEDKQRRRLMNQVFERYYPHKNDKLDCMHLHHALEYSFGKIITAYENNIRMHFPKYVFKFIQSFQVNRKAKEAKKEANELKNQVLFNDWRENPMPGFLSCHIKKILPPRAFKEGFNSFYYDIESEKGKIQDYLAPMVFMMKRVENQHMPTYEAFPTRKTCIPGYITIDTTSIMELLINPGKKVDPCHLKSKKAYRGRMEELKDQIWKYFFKTDMKCFTSKGHVFNGTILTDGVSISILLDSPLDLLKKHRKTVGKMISNEKKRVTELMEKTEDLSRKKSSKKRVAQTGPGYPEKKHKDVHPRKEKQKTNEIKFINDSSVNRSNFKNLTVVGIDPGKQDLIYCASKNEKGEIKEFRYSQNQRRNECKFKEFKKIRNGLRHNTKVNGRSIKEHEKQLGQHSSYNLEEFSEYLAMKVKVNESVRTFYEAKLFRKMKWNTFISTKRSEDRMIENFKKTFGNQKQVVIGYGSWKTVGHLKYSEPTKNVGLARLFRRAGFKIFLVNEHYTTKRCYKCGCNGDIGTTKQFLKVKNPRPGKKHEKVLRWGLRKCKKCHTIWNRDVNGSLNIYQITYNEINGLGRPKHLLSKKENPALLNGSRHSTQSVEGSFH